MTGPNEQRLIDFAETGGAWDMPGRLPLLTGLQSLKQVLQKVAENPGVVGEAGDAASAAFSRTATEVQEQINWIQVSAAVAISQANSVRERARESLATLPQGGMTEGQAAAVRGATVGATLVLGPVAFLAGEGAAAAINGYLANQREEAAARAMSTHATEMDEIPLPSPPQFSGTRESQDAPESAADGTPWGDGATSGGTRSGAPTFAQVPTGGSSGTQPGGGGFSGGNEGPGEYGPFPLDVPHADLGPRPPIDLGSIPPSPTPDGPLNGSPTLPGVIPAAPGSGVAAGGPGAGLGSGLSAGLIAGGGGAAALSRLARGAGAPGGSLFGRGTSAATASSRGGGLLGKTSPGASGLGTRGVGGLAGGAAGGGTPGSSTARGAGMRGGTTGATGGSSPAGGGVRGASGGAGTGGSRAAGGAGMRGIGGMGGTGSRSERRDDITRGLGGPIAPRMEDDEQVGPRSENAQAGERDE
ncbi:hypothetical protein [Microbacterium testaceum]|uniref:hypothetical protein n=1 Tax=Microbacterium testaceum TaxID=2033 RepID=UPI0022E382CA|nr:hypothetical protein [Microbacterium testaceum]